MGAVFILTPVVIAAWPAFSSAVAAAAVSLGYQMASEAVKEGRAPSKPPKDSIELEIPRSEVVTGQIGRDQRIVVSRDGITMIFSRDARGKPSICVKGAGQSEEVLRAAGEELGRAVVQQYVCQRLRDEARARGFVIVEEEANEDRAIHMKIRHWEG